jgi:hypothetical protein
MHNQLVHKTFSPCGPNASFVHIHVQIIIFCSVYVYKNIYKFKDFNKTKQKNIFLK